MLGAQAKGTKVYTHIHTKWMICNVQHWLLLCFHLAIISCLHRMHSSALSKKYHGIRLRTRCSDFGFFSPLFVSFRSVQHLINEKRVHKRFGRECKTKSTLIALAKLDGMRSANAENGQKRKTKWGNKREACAVCSLKLILWFNVSQLMLRPCSCFTFYRFFVLSAFTVSANIFPCNA